MATAPADPLTTSSSSALIVLATIATLGALYLGGEFFVPMCLGLLLAALLWPVVARLRRMGLPYPAGAAISVLGSLAVLVAVIVGLEGPVRTLAGDLPKTVSAARARVGQLSAPLRRLTGQGEPQQQPAPGPGARGAGTPPPPSSGGTSFIGRAFGATTTVLGELVELLLLAFFVLSAGDGWRRRVTDAARTPERGARALHAVCEIRGVVARYLTVTALINLTQAVVIALALWLLHIRSPIIWGALTFIMEFIPYLGGMVMMALLLLIGLASDTGLAVALLAPGIYLLVTTLQNNLVSPWAYGRGLRLNPTAILVAVVFWWLMWGVAGAFLAVPILAATRIIADHLPRLAPLGRFLED